MTPPVWHRAGDVYDFLYPDWALETGFVTFPTFAALWGALSIAKVGHVAYITGCVSKDLGADTYGIPAHSDTFVYLPRPYWPVRDGREAIGITVMAGETGGTPPADQSNGNVGVFGTTGAMTFWSTDNTVLTHDYITFAHSWLTDTDGE